MTRKEQINLYLKERNIPITSLEANSIIEGVEWADENPNKDDVYTKQELRDMGFGFDLNGNICTPNEAYDRAEKYKQYHKQKLIEKVVKYLENILPYYVDADFSKPIIDGLYKTIKE